jgi:hypothetical protein
MNVRARISTLLIVLYLAPFSGLQPLSAEQVPVRHREGLVHGFLVLRSAATGEALAEGELLQIAQGDRVTSELVFHFKDGSLHDETAVYSERGKFRLISDHLIQKGPSFKHSMDMTIDARTGQVNIHYSDEDGKEKDISEKLKAPPDLANGLTFTLLKNMDAKTISELSMIAATPKPRLVKLKITPQPEETFKIPDGERKATHFSIHIDIGGIAGWLAPILGKEPPDIHIWVLQGKAPAFLKAEGPLFAGGPIWRIELTSPQYPK